MKYICSLDIGTSKVAACLASLRGRELLRLWWDTVPVAGLKQGHYQDVEALTTCLTGLLKNLRLKSGIKFQSVYLSLVSQNIIAKRSQAVIALAERGNKSVTKTDIQRVNRQAQILGSCLEDEILYTEPLSYAVDTEQEVSNPLGLYGHQLKVDLYLICAKVSYINTIIEIIQRIGYKLNDIMLSGLAVSKAVFNPRENTGLSILCDIGKDITQILILNNGKLVHYQTLGCGADDLTVGLSRELNLPYSLAEEIKVSYGLIYNDDAMSSTCSKIHRREQVKSKITDKEVIMKRGDSYSTISQNLITQIITRQSYQIAQRIRDVIRPHLLAISPSLISDKPTLYVNGRTTGLDGFLELLEIVIGLPVKIVKIGNPCLLAPLMRRYVSSGESILNYIACLGMIAEVIEGSFEKKAFPHEFRNLFFSILDKMKEIYQEYF